MTALAEFATFIQLNMASLTDKYERTLPERTDSPVADKQPTASTRQLLNAVVEACKAENADPLRRLFQANPSSLALLELESLSQVLTPVAPNLEASKFLADILAQARLSVLQEVALIPGVAPGAEDAPAAGASLAPNYEFLEETLAITESLYQASSALNAAQTYDDVLQLLLDYTVIGEQAHRVSLSRFNQPWAEDQPADSVKVIAAHSQPPQPVEQVRYRVADFPLLTNLIRPDAPTLIEDVENDPYVSDQARQLFMDKWQARSLILVPLVAGGDWIGFLSALYRQTRTFSEDEIRHLLILASQAAVAIQSIARVGELQHRIQREAAIRAMTAKIRDAASLDLMLETAASELSRELDVPHAVLELGIIREA